MTGFQPEVFGKYYLVDKIAVGGMAEIFKAKSFSHAGFEKLLVIKRILAHHSENEEFVSMFIDEAKISAQLQHPNIVHVYDFGKLHANCYIAMECVDGKDVKQILRKLAEKKKLLPLEYSVFIAQEIAAALDHAHTKQSLQGEALGIIHRDISPANVLVSYAGDAKLADFGIAKAGFSAYDTQAGVLKGKFEYMSPEQARGEEVTQQSDLFSLGVVFYEMLTGRRLFKAANDIATLEKIKALDLRPPDQVNPLVDEEVRDIVMRLLSRDPEDRFENAHNLYETLNLWLHAHTEPQSKRRLSEFLSELFAQERSDERSALEEGSRIAQELHEGSDDLELLPEWEENTAGGTLKTQPRKRPSAFLLLFLLAVVAGAVALVMNLQQVEAPLPAAQATTGKVVLRVQPEEAQVFQGEELLGTGPRIELDALEPGEFTVRIEAEGFESSEVTVEVEAGSRTVRPIRLQPVTEVEEPAASRRPGRAAALVFQSDPPGAEVLIENRVVGITPLTWTEGKSGQSYPVRYRIDGHIDQRFQITVPGPGEEETAHHSLQPRPMGEGSIQVTVRPGWAFVYLDGAKVGETPLPLDGVSAGVHSIRLLNEATGLDETRSITVRTGETATLIVEND